MRKFYLYSLLTALLLLCSNVASAHDFEVDGIYYIVANSTAKTVAVTYSGSSSAAVADEYSGIVTIPSTVTYNDVTYIVEGIGKEAFYKCTGVILVNICEGVKIIGDYAFSYCSGLASVTIPNSVTSIGKDAFYECSSLARINIPNSVTTIGYRAFGNCTSLKRINITDLSAWCKIDFGDIGIVRSLTLFDLYLNGEKVTNLVIPSDITEIKKNTFQYCSGFTSIEIHNSVTSIGSSAFKYCSDLTNITIPESVTSIGDYAFRGCTGLTSVTIPNRVTSIGDYAFCDCTGLTSITIPNSVTTIGESAFDNCTGLTAVNITDLSAWCKIDFVTYAPANPLYYAKNLYLNGEKVTNLVIPSDITEIKKYAFYGCSGLTDITFHDNVMLINQYAFYGCSGLTNVTIGSGVMVLGAGAFETCSNLRCVTIPNSVISIGDEAFYNCSNLYTVIDYSDLGITKGSTDNGYVGYYATNIYTSDDDIPQDYIFETIDGVNTLVAYFGKSNDVVLPSNYNGGNYAIGDSVFYNSSITSIKIPNSVTSIGNCAFRGCIGLTSITIPNSVTSIGLWAFLNCPLEKVEINTTNIDSWFRGITSIKEIIIGDSVTSIGSSAFSDCTGLASITIPNSVTTIGQQAFSGCSGLASVTIPNSVTTIGNYAFGKCTGIAEIYAMSATPATAYSSTFSGVPTTATLYVPAGTKAAYQAANIWKRFTNIVEIPGGICGDDATWILRDSTLTISGSGAMYNYTDSVAPWSTYCLAIKEVVVNDNVTSIGNQAFYKCTGLTSIEIPNSVTSIGNQAFYKCTGLTAVNITDLSAWCKIDFDGSDSNPLYYAKNLYLNGEKVTNLVIPSDITEIKKYAFYNCTGLTSITIGNSVTTIGYRAFRNCTGLTSITIPNSVTSIGNYAFRDCTGLASIKVDSGNTKYDSRDNCNAIIETATNTLIQGCKNTIIPNSVTTIGDYAFYACDSLTSITIPNSVTTIGDYAFRGCTGLTSITIPNSVTSIGPMAFYNCTGLTEIYVKAITPPSIIRAFTNFEATLYVPTGTKEIYQAANYWKYFANIVEMDFDLTGDIDGDEAIDVADVTTLVSMILDNSLASDAADVDGDGTVDVADVTSLISIILGTDTASAAPAKAAATRAGEASTVSADGDGETLLINITNPAYEFSAIQFDLDLPEGIEVAMDEEYYEVYLGSRAHRKHSDPECAVQADGSLRVVIMSLSNALFSGTEGDVATVLLKANGAADGEYTFTIKNVVISSTGKEILAPYTGWITVSGGVTGIDEIKEERAESNAIYDLQGRKVTEPVKGGIYIVNGKKVIW